MQQSSVTSQNANQAWHERRLAHVKAILSNINDLQALYDACVDKAEQAGGGKTGVQFLIRELGLRKDDTTKVRWILHELKVSLHSRDFGYIKRSQNFWALPEAERTRIVEARQQGLVGSWQSATNEIREERGKAIAKARNLYSAMTEKQLAELYKQTPIPQSKSGFGSGGRFKFYHEVNGKQVLFHSGWELATYTKLVQLGVSFRFANESPGTELQLVGCRWKPDFIVSEDIIEVKGYFYAYQSFFNKILPAFSQSEFATKHKLWLLERSVEGLQIENYDELLAVCRLIHCPH